MSLKSEGKLAAGMLPTFDSSRQRTISSTSSILSTSSGPGSLVPKLPFASFYFGHLRRRPAFLVSLLATCLLIIFALNKSDHRNISEYLNDLPYNPFKQTLLEKAPIPVPQPLTELGFEADYVYENIGSTDLSEYRNDLEKFLLTRFPKSDADERNNISLISILNLFVPPAARVPIIHPQKALQHLVFMPWKWAFVTLWRLCAGPPPEAGPKIQPSVPKNIFQTGPWEGKEPPPEKLLPLSWKIHNPDYTYQYFDNAAAANYVNSRFNESFVNNGNGGGIAQTYLKMQDVPVMQSDFWRYAILATEGGIYCELRYDEKLVGDADYGPILYDVADIDTKCLKPVDGWHKAPWLRNLFENDPRPEPAIVVGIEVDVGSRPDWHAWWPRPLGMVQWTMASTKGHPILIDTMRRVVEAIDQTNTTALSVAGQHRKLESVVEKTGPAPFTDSVLRCERLL